MLATRLPAAALGLALLAWPLAAAADTAPGDPAETQAVETPGGDRFEAIIRTDFGLKAEGDERAHGRAYGLNLATS